MSMTPEQQAAVKAEWNRKAAILNRHLKPGDTITHTRCMGFVEEHIFLAQDGSWLTGYMTGDTKRISGQKGRQEATDISPFNVTHINRYPIDALDDLAELTVTAKVEA